MPDQDFVKSHEGRFSGSRLGCARSMALDITGYERVYSARTEKLFEIGQEHDAVMKEEAEEEFDDFHVPSAKVITYKRGKSKAEAIFTPDGLREHEVVEFKGLSANNFNSIRTEADLTGPGASPLFKKYYLQTQVYAGAFKKPNIRLRLKNKKNLKVKDILYKADPKVYEDIVNTMIDVQEAVNQGRIPQATCGNKEAKFCPHRDACLKAMVSEAESIPKTEIPKKELKSMFTLSSEYHKLGEEIKALELRRGELGALIKETMRAHGQREQDNGTYFIKYGVRYRQLKDKATIDRLVEEGVILVKDSPEEYLSVSKEENDGGR